MDSTMQQNPLASSTVHPLQPISSLTEPPLAGLAIVTPVTDAEEQTPKEYQQQDLYPVQTTYGPGQERLPRIVLCGPGIQHRNSIAGSTISRPVGRFRKGGSLSISADGPYFSNTQQFYNVFSFNQAQSYKLKVMARIERGFFLTSDAWTCYRRNYFQISAAFNIQGFDHTQFSEVPCLIELPDPLPVDYSGQSPKQPDYSMAQGEYDQQQQHLYRVKQEMNDESFEMMPAQSMGTTLDTGYNGDSAAPAASTMEHPMPVITGPTRLAVVTHFSVCITSKIESSNTKIGLIQHTPKRDKGPQNIPGRREIRGGGDFSLPAPSSNQTIVTFERVQFKTATANNGKRRATQQYYILMVDLYAHTEDGQVFRVAATQSDSLVVRGRSPGHYIDNPDGEMVLSPTSDSFKERRHSTLSQHSSHSSHPYHSANHFSGSQSRNHSISASAGISVEMSTLNLGLSAAANGSRSGGPLSPISPGPQMVGDYSPNAAGSATQSFFPNSTHQGWTDASSMSSPASTYDGSAFSSPTMTYPAFQQYQNGGQQPSPQENGYSHHHGQSYFSQRSQSFGSIPRMMMVGTPGAGVSPGGHSFDNHLGTTIENSYETEGQNQSPAAAAGAQALYTSAAGAVAGASSNYPGLGGYQQQQQSSVSVMSGSASNISNGLSAVAAAGAVGQFSMVKPKPDDSLQYSTTTSSVSMFTHATNGHFGHSELNGLPTPGSTTTPSSSASSSFGHTIHDLDSGMMQQQQQRQQQHPFLPLIPLNQPYGDMSPYDLSSYNNGSSVNGKDATSVVPGYLSLHGVKIEPEY
ncbi:meiosis-specific transcription factor ndt80 [Mortierella sp. GBA35]|nr:meiosis-specific transcription factor ndt80 [Mortierella sp. GBA35]